MAFLALLVSIPLLVWAIVVLLRGSVLFSTGLFLVATSCFPAELFAIDAAGLTWTLDRVWFVVLVIQAGRNWYRGELQFKRLEYCDVALGLFGMWLIARTITQPLGSVIPEQPPTLMHFVNGYMIPFTLYVVLRCTKLTEEGLKPLFWLALALGGYLSFTALMEVAGVWSLVFPRFIGDPDLGIHFGRARGPMLQSVRLGICLILAWTVLTVYTVWLKPDCRFRWSLFLMGTVGLGGAIFLTYTRSVWLGFASGILCIVILALQGTPRRIAIFCMASAVLMVGVIKGPDLVAFKREFSAAETRESTYMRAAFAYVSIEMVKDRPLAGFGFNQFQIYNQPYLSDRSTNIRLNSIRGYVHHNSFLSLLVDLGVIGFALYGLVAVSMVAQAWTLWKAKQVPAWGRGLALLAFVMGGTHLLQMAFHEVSFSCIENGILFSICGAVVAANQQLRQPAGGATSRRRSAD